MKHALSEAEWVHAFRRGEPRDAIVRECRRAQAVLYGYVVMPHHIHMLIRLPEGVSGPSFMRVFKRQSSNTVMKLLTEAERKEFDQRRGLNGNTFWQRSFRSISIETEETFWQKMDYIHANPVKGGYVEHPEQYRWSSAALIAKGQMSEGSGLSYDEVAKSLGAQG